MNQTFAVTGMTCGNCVEKIRDKLKENKNIRQVSLDLKSGRLEIEAEQAVSLPELNETLKPLQKYRVHGADYAAMESEPLAWFKTYYPLLLIFSLTMGIPLLALWLSGEGLQRWMSLAMGASLIAIAFFKFLDLPKFAEGFSTYDPVAGKVFFYGWLYPFLELGAGVLFLSGRSIELASVVVIVILATTTVGVLNALRQQRTIQCACLGTIFKLPLTKVTIFENIVMITMAALMLFYR